MLRLERFVDACAAATAALGMTPTSNVVVSKVRARERKREVFLNFLFSGIQPENAKALYRRGAARLKLDQSLWPGFLEWDVKNLFLVRSGSILSGVGHFVFTLHRVCFIFERVLVVGSRVRTPTSARHCSSTQRTATRNASSFSQRTELPSFLTKYTHIGSKRKDRVFSREWSSRLSD